MMRGFRQALEPYGLVPSEKGGGLVDNVMEMEEAKVLAREHNDRLLAELGLTHDVVLSVELTGPDSAFAPGTVIR